MITPHSCHLISCFKLFGQTLEPVQLPFPAEPFPSHHWHVVGLNFGRQESILSPAVLITPTPSIQRQRSAAAHSLPKPEPEQHKESLWCLGGGTFPEQRRPFLPHLREEPAVMNLDDIQLYHCCLIHSVALML